MNDYVTDDEFLAWIEERYDAEDICQLLKRYSICEDEDILANLDEYIIQLKGIIKW
jgi:hypothetical protein